MFFQIPEEDLGSLTVCAECAALLHQRLWFHLLLKSVLRGQIGGLKYRWERGQDAPRTWWRRDHSEQSVLTHWWTARSSCAARNGVMLKCETTRHSLFYFNYFMPLHELFYTLRSKTPKCSLGFSKSELIKVWGHFSSCLCLLFYCEICLKAN